MSNRWRVAAAFASVAILAACQSLPTAPTRGFPGSGFTQVGLASWYGPHFHGNLTADGERFDMNALTAAHRTLPFNSYVRVTDLDSRRSVVVRINDRGPFESHRIIDLSARAARDLGIMDDGTARVRVELMNGTANALDVNSPIWASERR